MNRYKLTKAGVDVSQGLKRLGNDKEFYENLLIRFCEDTRYDQLRQAMEQKDMEQAFQHAHALKGTAGNLSLTRLFDALNPLVEELRNRNIDHAQKYFPAVKEAYEILVDTLKS